MAEVLRQPSFPNEEFEQLRRSSLTSIDTQRSDPGALAGLALSRHLNPYPPEHWLYTATLDERSARLQALSLDDVKRCYADFYGASDSELAVVGDFDPEPIARLAQELFGGWKSPRPYARIPLRIADVAALAEELRNALAGGFSAEEVEAGKKGLLQSRQLARSSDGTVASRLVSYLVLGRTFAWEEELERRIAAMTPQAVVETLRRYIDPARLSVIKAGDFTSVAASPPGPNRAN